MRSFEAYANTKIATGLAVAAGMIGLSGCVADETKTSKRAVGSYGENSYVYPDQSDSSRVEAECNGTALIVKRVRNASIDTQGVWLNDVACADMKLTTEDDIASAVYAVSD